MSLMEMCLKLDRSLAGAFQGIHKSPVDYPRRNNASKRVALLVLLLRHRRDSDAVATFNQAAAQVMGREFDLLLGNETQYPVETH